MTTPGFVASHAQGATFERGLRSLFEYRDLGIRQATAGRVDAHVIRAAAGTGFSSQPHLHKTGFQLVYVPAACHFPLPVQRRIEPHRAPRRDKRRRGHPPARALKQMWLCHFA